MKGLLTAFIALAILTACNKEIPPTAPKVPQDVAKSITFHPGHMVADFENGEQAAIYFQNQKGQASVLLPAKGQFEITGNFTVDATGWYCLDNTHGDYLHIRRNGSASGKVRGMSFHLMPKTANVLQ